MGTLPIRGGSGGLGAALTANDATAIDATWTGGVEDIVLGNQRTRLNEIETRLKGVGVLP